MWYRVCATAVPIHEEQTYAQRALNVYNNINSVMELYQTQAQR